MVVKSDAMVAAFVARSLSTARDDDVVALRGVCVVDSARNRVVRQLRNVKRVL